MPSVDSNPHSRLEPKAGQVPHNFDDYTDNYSTEAFTCTPSHKSGTDIRGNDLGSGRSETVTPTLPLQQFNATAANLINTHNPNRDIFSTEYLDKAIKRSSLSKKLLSELSNKISQQTIKKDIWRQANPKMKSGDEKVEYRGKSYNKCASQSLADVVQGVPTLLELHTAELKHGWSFSLIVLTFLIYALHP